MRQGNLHLEYVSRATGDRSPNSPQDQIQKKFQTNPEKVLTITLTTCTLILLC
jgi:hypothetical protein